MAQYSNDGTKMKYNNGEVDIDYLISKCEEKYRGDSKLDEIINRVNTWGYMTLDSSKTNKYDGFIKDNSIDNCELAFLRNPEILQNYKEHEDYYLCQEHACKGYGEANAVRAMERVGDVTALTYENEQPIREIHNDEEFKELLQLYNQLHDMALGCSEVGIAIYYEKK